MWSGQVHIEKLKIRMSGVMSCCGEAAEVKMSPENTCEKLMDGRREGWGEGGRDRREEDSWIQK